MELHYIELGQIALEVGQAFRNPALLLILMRAQCKTSLLVLISRSLWCDELLLYIQIL